MRTYAWIVLLLLLAVIGCRSSEKKTEEDTPRTSAVETTSEVVVDTTSAVVEITPSVTPAEVLLEVPLTPEEEVVVAELEVRIAELERALNEGKKEIRDTLARLQMNREKKLGRIRDDLRATVEDFDHEIDEALIVKGGEDHGE